MGSHATPPTQPLTYHVGPTRLRDISVRIRFGQKKHGRFGQKHGRFGSQNIDVSVKMYLICLLNRILLIGDSPNKRFTE